MNQNWKQDIVLVHFGQKGERIETDFFQQNNQEKQKICEKNERIGMNQIGYHQIEKK